MKTNVPFPALALLLAAPLLALPSMPSAAPPQAAKLMSTRTLDINAWTIRTSNYGNFINSSGSSGGYWGGPSYNYIYETCFWLAATDTGGTRGVASGYSCTEFGPVNPYTESYENWLSDPQARVYLSTDPADVLEWPLRDPANRPVIRSMQDSYCKYSDQNPFYSFSGSAIVGIVVEQITYAWNYADNNDIVFFFFNVKNKNDYALANCRIAIFVDGDIGNEAGTSANDRTAFDCQRNLAMQFQNEPEPGWPRTGCIGFRFFESPNNNTGDTVRVVDNQYSRHILPGEPLGMTAFKLYSIEIAPQTDEQKYLTLEGYNYHTMIRDDYDEWGAVTPADKRFVQASGPFILKAANSGNPDSMTTLCVGIMAAWDTAALKASSDVAQAIFDNDFELAAPPAAPALTAVPGDAKVYLSWNKIAETNPDPCHAVMDSAKGWFTYFKGSWQYCTDKTLVDSFEIKTGSTTSLRVARDAPNPSGGTDTLYAFYSQKAMYCPYDFQAYALYRAASRENLSFPGLRTQLGVLHTGSSGAQSRNWDRDDGVQIVIDIREYAYVTPGGTYSLPIYDTLGTDCGLGYGFVDTDVRNGMTYWYGLSAIDYQPNVYFTHKCATTLASNPSLLAVPAAPRYDIPGSRPAGIQIRVDAGCQTTTDYWYGTKVVNPPNVPNDSFMLHWQPAGRVVKAGLYPNYNINYPVYRGHLYNGAKSLVDSVTLVPDIRPELYPFTFSFFGPARDELPFGGIVFQPFVVYPPSEAVIDSLVIIEAAGGGRTYPRDSIKLQLSPVFGGPSYSTTWQWRGSDFEIRWKDTLASSLTAQVWDLDNDVEVPLEAGVTKGNMVQSSWCFNPLAAGNGSVLVDSSTATYTMGMHIAGAAVYFNYAGTTLRRMTSLWPHRPETGDIWRVYCSGPRPPHQGGLAAIMLSPQKPGYNISLSPDSLLYQNIPNPFCGRTAIVYQVPGASPVSLHVYNILGQRVRTLVEGFVPSGLHQALWDGRDFRGARVSAGVYFCRLQIGNRALTRKMVLLR